MRLRALMLLSAIVSCAGACATVVAPAPETSPAPAAGSAPAPVEGYDWFFNADGDEARLAYGLAESDDLKLGLECGRGSGRVALNAIAGKGAAPEIHLESGGETQRFPAESEPSQLHDGVFLTAAAGTAEPVFQRFRRLGWVAQWRGSEREAYAPQAASRANIERFFAFCG